MHAALFAQMCEQNKHIFQHISLCFCSNNNIVYLISTLKSFIPLSHGHATWLNPGRRTRVPLGLTSPCERGIRLFRSILFLKIAYTIAANITERRIAHMKLQIGCNCLLEIHAIGIGFLMLHFANY